MGGWIYKLDSRKTRNCETNLETIFIIQGTKSIDLLTKAIRFQTQVTQLAITGRGIDNHLLAVERVAKESGLEVPRFLRDSNYDLFNNFKLSTSQVQTSSAQMIMCYGPVVPDGYGVCYNPQKVSYTVLPIPKTDFGDKVVKLTPNIFVTTSITTIDVVIAP